jgi:hypothetical protein
MLIYWKKIHNINKTKGALLVYGNAVDLQLNGEKTKYILMAHEQNAGQYYKNVGNKLIKSEAQFQYLRMSPRKKSHA